MAHQPAIAECVFGMKYRLQRSRFGFCHAQGIAPTFYFSG